MGKRRVNTNIEEVIKALDIKIPESSEENGEHFSESDKKKRYLLALRHVEKHMKEYQYTKEAIPPFPGQVQ